MIPALQSWNSAKTMALLIVLALTIGIESATAINTLLLTPVPYQHGERLVLILGAAFHDPNGMSSLTSPDVCEVEERGA
jgi:hypothetical protein